jgi:hypothetical protein
MRGVTVCCLFLSGMGLGLAPALAQQTADEEGGPLFDDNARLALQLWSEREKERAIAENDRRYWDYWLSVPHRYHWRDRYWDDLTWTDHWVRNPKPRETVPPPRSPHRGRRPHPDHSYHYRHGWY